MSDFYHRIMNLPLDSLLAPRNGTIGAYAIGHRDARHQAAEVSLEADARIAELEAERDEAWEWAEKLKETLMVVNAQHGGRNAARLLRDYRDARAALNEKEGAA